MNGSTRYACLLAACFLCAGPLMAADCAVVELDIDKDGNHTAPNAGGDDDEILVLMATRNDVDGGTGDTRTSTAGLYARLANRKKTVQLVAPPAAGDICNIDACLVDDAVDNKVVRIAYEVDGSIKKMQVTVNCLGTGSGAGSVGTGTVTPGGTSSVFTAASGTFSCDLDLDGTADANLDVTYHNPSISASGAVVAEAHARDPGDPTRDRWVIVASGVADPITTIDITSYGGTPLSGIPMRDLRRPSVSSDEAYIVFQGEIPESHNGTMLNGSQYGHDPDAYVYNVIRYDVTGGANEVLSTVGETLDFYYAARSLPVENIDCTHPRIEYDDPAAGGSGSYIVTWQSAEHLIDHVTPQDSDGDGTLDSTARVDGLETDKFGLTDVFRWVGDAPGTGQVYRLSASSTRAFSHPVSSNDGHQAVALRYSNQGGTYGWNVWHYHDDDLNFYRDAGEGEGLASGPVGGDAPMTIYPPAIGWAGKAAVIHTRGSAGDISSTMDATNDTSGDNPNDVNAIEDFVVVDLAGGLLVDSDSGTAQSSMLASMPDGQ